MLTDYVIRRARLSQMSDVVFEMLPDYLICLARLPEMNDADFETRVLVEYKSSCSRFRSDELALVSN